MSLGSHCNLISHCYGYSLDISCTLTIINFNYHLHHFSRHKSILRKGHIRTSRSLIDTTAAGNSPRWLSLLRLNYSGLSENDLSSTLDFKLWTHWLNSSNHVIDNDSFLLWAVEIEAGWPSFEGLKAEWETVLSWWETTALIDHRFATSEHVSCFIVFHLIMPVLWSTNVARSMIIFVILLRLTIWDSEVLNELIGTSVLNQRWAGTAAIGSNWGGGGGGGGCPGLRGGACRGVGRCISFASSHFTH